MAANSHRRLSSDVTHCEAREDPIKLEFRTTDPRIIYCGAVCEPGQGNWITKGHLETLNIDIAECPETTGSLRNRLITSEGSVSLQVSWDTPSLKHNWAETQFYVADEDDFDIILDENFLGEHGLDESLLTTNIQFRVGYFSVRAEGHHGIPGEGNWISSDFKDTLNIQSTPEFPSKDSTFHGRLISSVGFVTLQWYSMDSQLFEAQFNIADEDEFHFILDSDTVSVLVDDHEELNDEAISNLDISPTLSYKNFLCEDIQNQNSCDGSDGWVKSFKERLDLQFGSSKTENPIKIAVLDTGCNQNHPYIQAFEGRINEDYRNFVTPALKNVDDSFGHGTHIAGIILNLTRHTEVYIGKVSIDPPEGVEDPKADPRAIAEAIEYAVTQWKVDIISMSFGLNLPPNDKAVKLLEEKIRKAHKRRVVMFAAARNDGANEPVAFPAKCNQVICIRSTDHHGNPSVFNPTEDEITRNLATLGENIRSAWLNKKMEYKSGSSFATPMAVSIYAWILALARMEEFSEDHQERLKCQEGALQVLCLGSKKHKDCLYINPSYLINKLDDLDLEILNVARGFGKGATDNNS